MFRDNKAPVFGLAVSGGLVASGSEDGAVRLWSTATHARVAVHWGHAATVMSVALSETCVLSTSEDATAMAWPLFDGKRLAVMRHPPDGTVSCVSTHGRLAVTSQAQSVIFWSLDTFKSVSARIVVHDGATYSVHLCDKTLVTGSWGPQDPCTKVWQVTETAAITTIQCTGVLRGHGSKDVVGAASSADGFVVTVGELDRLIVWKHTV